MANNTINWGSIYDSTWWGVGVTSNSISWGEIYKDIAGFPVFIELFQTRVTADGGVIESLRCINENLIVLSDPIITLLGDAITLVDVDTSYTDAGATAFDRFLYGDLTSSIVAINNVDTRSANVYEVTYNVTDPSDRAATEVVRTVYVTSELANSYRDRIALDSGVVENLQCVDFDYSVDWGQYILEEQGYNEFISRYETRVSTDLGTMESVDCISRKEWSQFSWNYNFRVTDDSGTIERLGCVIYK